MLFRHYKAQGRVGWGDERDETNADGIVRLDNERGWH